MRGRASERERECVCERERESVCESESEREAEGVKMQVNEVFLKN